MNKNFLIGNGVNIHFSRNDDYKNWAILARMKNNLEEPGRYTDRFAGTIDAGDLDDILDSLYRWFTQKASKGIYALKYLENQDDVQTFLDICRRCEESSPDVLNIGMEDYLFILKLFNESTEFGDIAYETLYQGVTPLLADAIYNDGKIEKLYQNMGALADALGDCASVFTVNYDRNVDKITDKKVYHLHGAFDHLYHEYRADTLKGWIIRQSGKDLPYYTLGKEYLYSDAVFGYSGTDKLNRMLQYNQPYTDFYLARIRNEHPELLCPAYPIEEFKEIEGELHIIGLGPNNDSHIFNMINENDSISKVCYYFKDWEKVKSIIKRPLEAIDVFEFWSSIGE